MRRALWLGVGLAVGALAVRRVSRVLAGATPQGVARCLSDAADGARDLLHEVRQEAAQREADLCEALGLAPAPDEYPRPRD